MIKNCYGCKSLPDLLHRDPVPPCMEPIVFVRRPGSEPLGFLSAYECVCCGRQWVEVAPSPGMVPRFVLASRQPAPALQVSPDAVPGEAQPGSALFKSAATRATSPWH